MSIRRSFIRQAITASVLAATAASSQSAPSASAGESYSPYAGRQHPANVYWGDMHLHTNLSFDAYGFGNRLGPADAYRFARGEQVTANNGMEARLRRPLDFLVITDHAEGLGLLAGVQTKDARLMQKEAGRRLSKRLLEINELRKTDPARFRAQSVNLLIDGKATEGLIDDAFTRSVWEQVTANADRFNESGQFTTFAGYEWSSAGSADGNLHRVVVFRDGADAVNRIVPFSSLDSRDPEQLWAFMADYEKRTGGQVLAIPHNGNTSNGEMFPLVNFSGASLSRAYAQMRSRWEPLYEVTQIKGDSESHPFLSPTDEFADFEIWNSWGARHLPAGRSWDAAEKQRKEGEYARSALKRGLAFQAELGVNPFKFGLIGSTDAHTSLSAPEENNAWGKEAVVEPSAGRMTVKPWASLGAGRESSWPIAMVEGWEFASGGYAAVWATENTREALFAALKRKETYATTGSRIQVRFFAGWDYVAEDASRPDLALIGYRKGVPMGGDLTNAPAGRSPRLLIHAVKDPDGPNLDRVQVIKGWRDRKGELREKIYNVALSGGRKESAEGKAPAVGNTVDVPNATYTNAIGDPELAVVWTDPQFNPGELAFYYVRVLEIPTPRWTAHDAKFFKIKNVPANIPLVTQERAYTSPIWFSPAQQEAK